MSGRNSNRADRRAQDRDERDRDRRIRTLAATRLAELVEADETISGATLILPNGSTQFLDAALLRRGGRA